MPEFDVPRIVRPAAPHTLARVSDGDTPVIDQPVRLVSVDTPRRPATPARPRSPRPSWTPAGSG